MENIIVDATGEVCPKPLIITKKKLKETEIDGKFIVLIDNETSKENVERFLYDNQIMFHTSRKDNIYSIEVTKTQTDLPHPAAEEYCRPSIPVKNAAGHVVCFTSNQMGTGPAELGQILVQACINTIKEVEPLPKAIVFYNSGVTLAVEGSPVLESLQNLEKSAVKILVCGTCANFFQVKEQIRVGLVSNMYDILETLSHAGHIVYP
jgi:selenium metabolism protein YedF